MQNQSTFFKKEFIAFFLYFLTLITLLIITHHTFLGVQDEAQLYATLKANEPINYMTSYPFALLGGYLYTHFPSMQWYSILMTFYIILLTTLFSWYLALIRIHSKFDILLKILLFSIFTLMTLHMLFEVDVTTPTLLLIVMAIPFIRYHQAYFWFIVWIASFLRSQIIISLFPLLLLAYIAMVAKVKPKQKDIFMSLLFIILALTTHFSYKLNPTYDKWMDFTEKRAYFTDFDASPKHNILTSNEHQLARTWWIVDQDLYPYKKVMADAGGTLDIIKSRFEHISPKHYIAFIFHGHHTLYFLFILSIFVSIFHKSYLKLIGYLGFGSVLVLLLIVKDVDRVTMPMILMWWSMIISDLWCIEKREWLFVKKAIIVASLSWVLYYLFNDIPWNRITHYQAREAMVKELKELLNRNKMQLEITSGFTSSWDNLVETIMQNHLFDEKNWIDYYDDLLLQGWFSRVPLVYKQHNISFNGVKRKYEHYHDWLLDPKSGFLGSTGETRHIHKFLRDNLMHLYDQKFPQKGCKHIVIPVDITQHFIIHRVTKLCQDNLSKQFFNLMEKSPSIKYINMEIKNEKMVAKNDPQLIINYQKRVPRFIKVVLEINSPINSIFQLFYKRNPKDHFSEANSIIKQINKGWNRITVIIPGRFLKYPLRIDPIQEKGTYTIKSFQLEEFYP